MHGGDPETPSQRYRDHGAITAAALSAHDLGAITIRPHDRALRQASRWPSSLRAAGMAGWKREVVLCRSQLRQDTLAAASEIVGAKGMIPCSKVFHGNSQSKRLKLILKIWLLKRGSYGSEFQPILVVNKLWSLFTPSHPSASVRCRMSAGCKAGTSDIFVAKHTSPNSINTADNTPGIKRLLPYT